MAKVDIMQDSETTKPILKITVGADIIYISANVGEMIGGAAAGARLRWEDQQ
jgi:hypothetical protein